MQLDGEGGGICRTIPVHAPTRVRIGASGCWRVLLVALRRRWRGLAASSFWLLIRSDSHVLVAFHGEEWVWGSSLGTHGGVGFPSAVTPKAASDEDVLGAFTKQGT